MYLIGRREAILRIAASRWALVVGAMLVLSASLARNYDGAYLIKEWDVLLHGVVVSAMNSLVLFSMMWVGSRRPPTAVEDFGQEREPALEGGAGSVMAFVRRYLSFLGLFWMSAPMAWLYGIPYERWFTSADAVQANLYTLAIVSVWRVALMTRVLSVIFGARVLPTFFVVMLFSDVAVVIGAIASPKPLVDFMGGMQHSPEDAAISNANFLTMFFGIVSLPVWFIGWLWAMAKMRGSWQVGVVEWGKTPRGLIAAAVLSVAAWIVPMMMKTQAEQRSRWEADTLLRAGKIDEALTFMSAKGRGEFPPIWDPVPRIGWGERTPMIEDVAKTILQREPAAWVGRMYVIKSGRYLFTHLYGGWRRLAEIVESPQPQIAGGDAGMLARLRLHEQYDDTLSEDDRTALNQGIEVLEARLKEARPVLPEPEPSTSAPELNPPE